MAFVYSGTWDKNTEAGSLFRRQLQEPEQHERGRKSVGSWDSGSQNMREGPGLFPPKDRLGHLPADLSLQWWRLASGDTTVPALLSVSVHNWKDFCALGEWMPWAGKRAPQCALAVGQATCMELSTTAVLKLGWPVGCVLPRVRCRTCCIIIFKNYFCLLTVERCPIDLYSLTTIQGPS